MKPFGNLGVQDIVKLHIRFSEDTPLTVSRSELYAILMQPVFVEHTTGKAQTKSGQVLRLGHWAYQLDGDTVTARGQKGLPPPRDTRDR
jgi:hypothetical protein